MSVAKAANDVEALVALRNRLAFEIDMADSAQNLAVLSRQFLAVLEELAEMKPAEASRVDEIAEKYAKRLQAVRSPNAPRKASAKRQTKSG